MKNLKRILIAVAVLAALVAGLAVTAWASEASASYTGTVAELSALVNAAEASGGDARLSATVDAYNYVAQNPVDPTADGYGAVAAKLDALGIEGANALIAGINTDASLIEYGVAAKKLKSFVASCPVAETAVGYAEYKSAVDEAISAYDKAFADNKNALEDKTPFNEYGGKTFINRGFDDGVVSGLSVNAGGNTLGIHTDPTGNKVYRLLAKEKVHSYVYASSLSSNDPSVVIEFDMTTLSKMPALVKIEAMSTMNTSNGTQVYPHYMQIKNYGQQLYQGVADKVLAENVIVPTQWTHITIVLDRESNYADYYVDYVWVGNCFTGGSNGVTYKDFATFRIGIDSIDGELELDNFRIYSGSGIRTEGRFDSMSEEALFVYYSQYLSASDDSMKLSAYSFAGQYIDSFYDGENYLTDDEDVRAAVDAYLAFDYDAVMNSVKTANLAELLARVAELKAIERTPESYEDRSQAVGSIKNLLSKYGDNIIKNDEYNSAVNYLDVAARWIEEEDDIKSFIEVMDRFSKSIKVHALQNTYNEALNMIYGTDYSIPLALAVDENTPFTEFKAAYEAFLGAEQVVENAVREDNAKSIVARVGYMSAYTSEDWENDEEIFAYVDMFAVIVRATLREGRYDPYYPGVQAAIEAFAPIDEYFYGKLQERHIVELQGVIDKFVAASAYVEKMGYVAYIQRYLAKNDIDYTNTEIAKIMTQYETFCEEMEMQEADYAAILEQNTVLFINSVNMLAACVGYNDTLATYEEAAVYYYAMNVGSAEAQAAIAIFDKVTENLKIAKENSMLFIEQTVVLSLAETANGKFAALVACASCVPNIELAIDGVEAAYNNYLAALASYNSLTDTANAEVESSISAVAATRANSTSTTVLAIIFKKMEEMQ